MMYAVWNVTHKLEVPEDPSEASLEEAEDAQEAALWLAEDFHHDETGSRENGTFSYRIAVAEYDQVEDSYGPWHIYEVTITVSRCAKINSLGTEIPLERSRES